MEEDTLYLFQKTSSIADKNILSVREKTVNFHRSRQIWYRTAVNFHWYEKKMIFSLVRVKTEQTVDIVKKFN